MTKYSVTKKRKKRFKLSRLIGPGVWSFLIAALIRLVGLTLRIRVDDRAGLRERDPEHPLIWVFWHNRIFSMPFIYRKYLKKRHGAVLTSPSGDGEIIAKVMARFGVGSVRGSSNKRATAALKEMVRWLNSDARNDLAITPDGPRGPVYELQPGVVKVAQLTQVPVLPIRVRYEKCYTMRTWDKFMIPKPFSRVYVVIDPFEVLPGTDSDEGFEKVRMALQVKLQEEVAVSTKIAEDDGMD